MSRAHHVACPVTKSSPAAEGSHNSEIVERCLTMELLGFLWMPAWLLYSLILVSAVLLYITWPHGTFQKLNIPGPKPGLFGILGMYKRKGLIWTDVELIQKYGKMVGIYEGRNPVLLMADPEGIKQICVKDFSTFTNRSFQFPRDKFIRLGLLNAVDDQWKTTRSIISPTFSSAKMRNMTPLVQSALDKLVNNIRRTMKKDNKINAKSVFGAFTMDVIASTGFGLDVDCQQNPNDPFVKNTKNLASFSTTALIITAIGGVFPFMKNIFEYLNITVTPSETVEFFNKVASAIVDERTETSTTKRRDMLQQMMDTRQAGTTDAENDFDKDAELKNAPKVDRGLTREEIVANSVIFLLAGFETTATTLTHASYLLATHPECQNRLYEEISQSLDGAKPTYDNVWKLLYLDNVISETLRLHPAIPRTRRISSAAQVIKGVQIPKGIEVHMPIYALHHDPDVWPDPEIFDPDRFLPENKSRQHPYAWIPFGAGPRSCVGMRLALLEVKMVLAVVLQNFIIVPTKETKIPLEIDIRSQVVRPSHPVFLGLEERNHID